MKNFKRIIALASASVFALSFAACGSKSAAESTSAASSSSVSEAASEASSASSSSSEASSASTSTSETKVYKIATDMGFAPFEFQDADSNIVGIDMDIIRAIAEDQGFEIEIQYVGWDAAIAACQSGQADAMIAGASITDDRKASGWIFSDGYYDATQGMAVSDKSDIAGFEDLKGKTVAVKTGTMSERYATELSETYDFTVNRFETSPDMYQAVTTGQADACFDDTPILKYNISSQGLAMKFVEGTENEPAEYGMAIFNEANQELIDLFNAGLANIKADGTYDEIIAKYLG